ncbi:hypothetical protein [Thalassotalea profundi]|uniref:Lipocalin-like domain-containing protein n=1 Tax=Thalassotalea profundi TaxID=2036687 RepID=A0ABQ3ILZ3_9GAMM|nr:hypothetical protein [Thalassotalea profundi]GHE86798.1 hypothetical protein GCM10011501_15040 [Thalassotalea profundi]
MNYERNALVGQWFSSTVNSDGEQSTEFSDIQADGSFEFTFSHYDRNNNLVEQRIELGDWGLVGDIHFTMTKSEFINEQHYASDLSDADNYHAYKVLELNASTFKYQHVITQEMFILKRVIDKIGHC